MPGGRFRFSYSLAHELGNGPALWAVGETIDTQVEAFVSDQEADVPRVGPSTGGDPVTAEATGFTQTGSDPGSTTLVPLLLEKSEPSAEAELLRGVHDHQTVYTLTVETGCRPGGVDIGRVEDWIPAGLEFLGCGTEDNSTTEEYPGSGALNPGNAPAVTRPVLRPGARSRRSTAACPPDSSGRLHARGLGHRARRRPTAGRPPRSIAYVAGIPQRENTLTWPGGAPLPGIGQPGDRTSTTTPGRSRPRAGERDDATRTRCRSTRPSRASTRRSTDERDRAGGRPRRCTRPWTAPTIQQGGDLDVDAAPPDVGVRHGRRRRGPDRSPTPHRTAPARSAVRTPAARPPRRRRPTRRTRSHGYDSPATGETTLTWDLADRDARPERDDVHRRFSTVALTRLRQRHARCRPTTPGPTPPTSTANVDDVRTGRTRPPAGYVDNAVTDDTSAEQSGTVDHVPQGRRACPPTARSAATAPTSTWDPDLATGVGPGDRVCFRLTAEGARLR